MKKIWLYISIFLTGALSALTIAVKYLIPDKVVINVKKQRIWGRGNEMNTTVPIEIDNADLPIQTKREARKQAGVIRRNEKKEKKAKKRLNKIL